MRLSVFNRVILTAILTISISSAVTAQAHKSPADTGRIEWGHKEFDEYLIPSMCHSAAKEFHRYKARPFKLDTGLAMVLDSTEDESAVLSAEDKDAIRNCISKFTPDDVPLGRIWGYVRSALLIGEDQKALRAADRAIREASDSSMIEDAYVSAITSFASNVPRRFDLAHKYLDKLEALTSTPSPGSMAMRLSFLQYWAGRYYKDSIRKHASSSIERLHKMHPENLDMVEALYPYAYLIQLANDEGDIPEQQKILDSMEGAHSDWRGGEGATAVITMQRTIDSRKKLYNKKASPITEGLWFNTNSSQWPSIGKISLIVMIDHTCGLRCWDQYKTIKRMKTIFGDDIHITLATQSSGYSIGTLVLDEKAEGDSIVHLFSKVYDMNFTVVLDSRPVSRIPDGRYIAGTGPLAEMFQEWRGMDAILADREGRIQWIGRLSGEVDRRAVIATINRLLEIGHE